MSRLFLIILVAVLLGACTMKATYNRLDWLAAKKLSSYVELTDEQKLILKQRMTDTLQWHRSTQLPAYAQWLSRVQVDLSHPLTEEQADHHMLELMGFWRSLMMRLADDLAYLLPQLNSDQRMTLYARFEQETAKYKQETTQVKLEDRQDQYAARLEKGLARWLGELTEQQKHIIQAAAETFQPTENNELQRRVSFQRTIRNLLERHASEDEIRTAFHSLLLNKASMQDTDYGKRFENNRRVFTGLIVELSTTLEERQETHLNKRIDKFIKLFNDLSLQGRQQAGQSCAAC